MSVGMSNDLVYDMKLRRTRCCVLLAVPGLERASRLWLLPVTADAELRLRAEDYLPLDDPSVVLAEQRPHCQLVTVHVMCR